MTLDEYQKKAMATCMPSSGKGVKNSYFLDEEYYFADDETKIVTFVEMLKNRGYQVGEDGHIRGPRGSMKSKLMRNGYYMTSAQYDTKMYYFMEHRVVWVWFNGGIPADMEVNHKDYNRGNNRLENLELLTRRENLEYSRPNFKPCKGEKSPKATFSDKQASAIKTMANVLHVSPKRIGEMVNVKPYNVTRISHGKRYPDACEYADILEAYPAIVDLTRNRKIGKIEELKNYSMGLAGEAGECVDLVKKWLYHGKEIDHNELMLELGDVLYYLVAICNVLGMDIDLVALNNNAKLLERYKNGYSEEASNDRVEDKLASRKERGVIDGNGDNR